MNINQTEPTNHRKKGKKEFVVLPYKEFLKVQEALEDYEDLRDLRKAKAKSKGEKSTPLNKVIDDLDLQ